MVCCPGDHLIPGARQSDGPARAAGPGGLVARVRVPDARHRAARRGARTGRATPSTCARTAAELRGEPYDGAWQVLELQQCARELRELAARYAASGLAAAPCGRTRAADRVLRDLRRRRRRGLDRLRGVVDAARQAVPPGADRGDLGHLAGARRAHAAGGRRRGGSAPPTTWSQTADLFAGLLTTVTEARRVLVEEREDLRNNYTAWLICAGVSCSRVLALLGHDVDVDDWLDGPAGLWAHVDVAVHDDGWEWEASTYYHFFVLRAYLLALRDRVPADLPAPQRDTIAAMLRVLVDLSTDGGVLPVLHDGPYRRPQALQELLEVCVLGRQLVELPGLERLEDGTRAQLGSGRLHPRGPARRPGSPGPRCRPRRRAPGPARPWSSPTPATSCSAPRAAAGRPWSTPARTEEPTATSTSSRSTSTATARSGSRRPGCRRTGAPCAATTTPAPRPTRPSGSTGRTRRRRPAACSRGRAPRRSPGPWSRPPVRSTGSSSSDTW